MKQNVTPKSALRALLIVCCVLASGCQQLPTTAKRNASFAPFQNVKLYDTWVGRPISAQSYLMLRTAFLADDRKENKFGFGLAAAIDRRGYYLTAAHCVRGDKISLRAIYKLPAPGSNGEVSSAPGEALVVWKGDVDRGEPDLAILYSPRPPETVFEWEPEIKYGGAVFSAGNSYERKAFKGFEMVATAGKLLPSIVVPPLPSRWSYLVTTAPLQPGDSGGALATTEGRLLAINFNRHPRLLGPNLAVAIRPDLAWLGAKLDEDYARRTGTPVALFWARPNPSEYLADLLIARLHEREAARMAAGEPND
ncbi:MAG: serine protease, partial [Opitutaceae bacterium]